MTHGRRWTAEEVEQVRTRSAALAVPARPRTKPAGLAVSCHARKRGLGARRQASVVSAVPVLERDVLRSVRTALRVHPAVQAVWRVNSGAHLTGEGAERRFIRYHTIPGMSDLLALLKPRYGPRLAFIEVKRPGKQPTQQQAAFLAVMRERGHAAFIASDPAQAWRELSQQLAAWERETAIMES